MQNKYESPLFTIILNRHEDILLSSGDPELNDYDVIDFDIPFWE